MFFSADCFCLFPSKCRGFAWCKLFSVSVTTTNSSSRGNTTPVVDERHVCNFYETYASCDAAAPVEEKAGTRNNGGSLSSAFLEGEVWRGGNFSAPVEMDDEEPAEEFVSF